LAETAIAGVDLTPTAYEHLIDPELVGHEGLGQLIDALRDNQALRRALVLRATNALRDRISDLSFEAECSAPITLEAQDALVLLDLLLRRLG